MIRTAHGIDYEAELASIRDAYVCATPRQRLNIIRQRLAAPVNSNDRPHERAFATQREHGHGI